MHESLGLTSDFFMCRYCVLTTYSMLEGSLMPMSSHYPSTVTTLDLSQQTLAFPVFALDLPFQKLQAPPPHKLLEGLIFPFTFRCTIQLEILTYGVRYGAVGGVSSLQRISNWPT